MRKGEKVNGRETGINYHPSENSDGRPRVLRGLRAGSLLPLRAIRWLPAWSDRAPVQPDDPMREAHRRLERNRAAAPPGVQPYPHVRRLPGFRDRLGIPLSLDSVGLAARDRGSRDAVGGLFHEPAFPLSIALVFWAIASTAAAMATVAVIEGVSRAHGQSVGSGDGKE